MGKKRGPKLVQVAQRDLTKMRKKIERQERAKKKKELAVKVDGLSAGDVEKIRKAIRQVWSWSYPRKLCIQRATDEDGFPVCELCKTKVPKVYPDHITPVGDVDAGFIKRLFCPSKFLQALCRKCHAKKTKQEREDAKSFY